MKKIVGIFLLVLIFSACSEDDQNYILSDDASIKAFGFKYKNVAELDGGDKNLVIVDLIVSNEVNTQSGELTVTASIPAPSGNFSVDERRSVSLDNLAGFAEIPGGARIEPLDGAPVLGIPGDFSVNRRYKVTAADGKASKIWTIKVNPLPLVNQYEGVYQSSGYFDHPTSPRNFELSKYMATVDATTLSGEHSDLGWLSYSITIKINPDNTVVVKQLDSEGVEIGEMVSGAENKYNPVTKTFTLNYRYSGSNGWRTISETLVLN